MKFFVLPVAIAAALSCLAPTAQADSRQYIVVVAEGLSPQLLNLGQSYLSKADEDPELVSSFSQLAKGNKPTSVGPDVWAEMKGLLETAHTSGFKTGFITTGDLTTEAPRLYNVAGDALGSPNAHYDYLGGGGRAKLEAAGEAVTEAGGTYIGDTDGLVREIKGRVLAAQADEEMSYALDRDPEKEGGLSELATMAMDMLGDDDTPYVLVIHDTLIQKALEAQDTPALFEEFRELDSILGDALGRRDDNAELSVTAIMPGATVVPQFLAGANAEKSYGIISALGRSYQGVGQLFQKTDTETINDLIDPESGEYRDWKLNDADKKRIVAGKLDGQTAVRAFYVPLLGLEYREETIPPTAYSLALDTTEGLIPALKTALSQPAK